MTPTHLQDLSENVLLHGCIVHSDRASSNFDPIQDKIIMLSADLYMQRSRMKCAVID